MFNSKEEINLSKLIEKQNIEFTTMVKNQVKNSKDETIFQVEASGTVFDPAQTGDRGPLITKRVSISATGKDIESAQNSALSKLQELLGL